ncbi:MAG: TldD/PmbA family protein [bacterium]|nr:TldD/PmbA family protein [bacterium]
MELIEICEQGLKEAIKLGASEVEIYAASSKHIEVTIEKNDIQIAKSQIEDGVGIRVFKDKRLGFASLNDFSEIKEGCKRAVELAKASPKDEYNKLPEPVEIKKVDKIYDPDSEDFGVKQALEHGICMLNEARNYDQRITVDNGSFTANIAHRAVANSNGVRVNERTSSFVYYIVGMAVDGENVSSFEYEFDGVRFVNQIDTRIVAQEMAKNVVNSIGAGKGESFKGSVILSPNSVGELIVGPMLFALNANNVQKGMSKWVGKIGKKVGTSNLIVEDNGVIPGGLGSSAFDREGMPHYPLTMIKNGELISYMYNTYTATKEHRTTTGHASGSTAQIPGIGPTNFIIKEGTITKDKLIRGVRQGVIVTRFSGFPNPVTGEFSGAVKGGWLIKHGEPVKPLCETLIHGNIYDLLTQISGISIERKKVLNYILPWICIDGVSVTAG